MGELHIGYFGFKFFFIILLHHPDYGSMRMTGVLREAVSHIGAREFYDALLKVWLPKPNRRRYRLGLALSGGVDSTALAILCKSLTNWSQKYYFDLTAFVVDHKAREGSTDEAKLVCQRFQDKLGLETHLLTLQWPEGMDPSKLASFETNSRMLRYQALGQACYQHGISSLLLGHHEDDQAETVLVRLATGHRTSGLRGIRATAPIAECWGIYGVDQSGTPLIPKPGVEIERTVNRDRQRALKSVKTLRRQEREMRKSYVNVRPLTIEGGGVALHRPLLTFAKERLIATCEFNGFEWIEDRTNDNVTLTIRNTVRRVLSEKKLPLALRKPNLLLIAQDRQTKQERRDGFVDYLFNTGLVKVLEFDTRSGRLVVSFPEDIKLNPTLVNGAKMDIAIEKKQTAKTLLHRLAIAVTPKETFPMQPLSTGVGIIFNALGNPSEPSSTSPKSRKTSFNAGNVLFDLFGPVPQRYPRNEDKKRVEAEVSNVWQITREPFMVDRFPVIEINGRVSNQTSEKSFQLWDGRFWIRVDNHTPLKMCVRSFNQTDMEALSNPSRKFMVKDLVLVQRLRDTARGKTRWTLPVIALPGDDQRQNGELIALPSLNLLIEGWERKVRWEIRYKRVDLAAFGAESLFNRDAFDWPLVATGQDLSGRSYLPVDLPNVRGIVRF
ncbi:MAG: hypothetical protein MMC33_003426 [Icmadophila ericetorum]|nr:hypothetical protein [Icmadophila ericetorum]